MSSTPHHIYLRDFDPDGQSSLAKIARRVGPGTTILDLGIGPGILGKYLATSKGCVIDGVEYHPQQAEMAAPAYRKVQVADLEQVRLADLFPGNRYDIIICADVLEHLRDPGRIIDQLPALLKPAGRVLLSVPNVAYIGLIADLMAGDFQYRPEGLLDSTHVRFFTRNSLLSLLAQRGLSVTGLDTVPLPLQHSEFGARYPDALPPAVYQYLCALPDAQTYQFIVEAMPGVADAVGETLPTAEQRAPELSFFCRIYWKKSGEDYESRNVASALARIGKSFQNISFPIPATGGPLAGIRLAPSDRPGYLAFHGMRLFNSRDDCVWTWDGDISVLESLRPEQVVFASGWHGGYRTVALITGNEPQMELPISDRARSALRDGGRLEVEMSWPMSSDYLALAQRFLDPVASPQHAQGLERALATARDTITAREAELGAVRGTIAAQEEHLNTLRSWLATRDAELADAVAVREAEMARLRNAIAARDAELAGRDAELALARETTSRREAELTSVREALAARDGELASVREMVAQQQHALSELDSRIEARDAQVQEILRSTSWRVTRPLRFVGGILKVAKAPSEGPTAIGRLARRLFRALPLSYEAKTRLRYFIYRNFPLFLTGSAGYRNWLLAQSAPVPAREAGGSVPPAAERAIVPPGIIRLEGVDLGGFAAGLKLADCDAPMVSVVIPVFNNVEYTLCCLGSICRHPAKRSFEVIVIDDCSSDETPELVRGIAGVRYVRNGENLGFIRSCNRGAALARGRYVMFLNNDTQVLAGWLDALVDVFDMVPDAGLAGSKLIYPSGHLQDAGTMMNRDGTALMVGLNDAPDKPQYNYMREVDYCSGASILLERDLFTQLGGFDEMFLPAYYEDADLGFRVRQAGKRVMYQPASVVVHHLSVTTNDAAQRKNKLIGINRERFVERWQAELYRLNRVRLIAFYLPQYHPIPENDEWWGKGFTEWTNVAKAKPNFEGHYQPRLPADLGFYDLRVPEVREEQAQLAKDYGVHGFCYYYYWFGGKRLLHRPLDDMLQSGKPDFPFCVCWANENWTRKWDGQDSTPLISQHYSEEDDLRFIESLIPLFKDPRYIRIEGRPLLLLYRVSLLPDPAGTARLWRQRCREAGLGELYLACVQSFDNLASDPRAFGFDAAVEFAPHGMGVVADTPKGSVNPEFRGTIFDYVATSENYMRRETPPYPLFRGVMPSWDNTARRQSDGHVFIRSDPKRYEEWLRDMVGKTRQFHFGDERILFVNAWNEWAEGTYLEPDRKYGRQYLEATRDALGQEPEST